MRQAQVLYKQDQGAYSGAHLEVALRLLALRALVCQVQRQSRRLHLCIRHATVHAAGGRACTARTQRV